INALMAVAVTGAFCIGQFPEAAMVMALFNLSEALEARALDRARNAVSDLLALAPPTATVLQLDGSWQEVPAAEVGAGSRVRVRPGERVALDGVVSEGRSTLNQAPITGESIPVEKGPGDTVYAGTINESGAFEFTVTAAAQDTTLARIIHAVEEAQATRAPMQRFVDRFARWYTPAVFALAILTALVPPLFFGAAWTNSIYMALVLLVIGCPCALVISTPVTVVSGMAAAARKGILIKGGAYLEQGRLLNCLALDKTGTLTRGEPRQTDFVLLDADAGRRDEVALMAASVAARSDHPVSRAVAAAGAGLTLREVEAVEALPGEGIAASHAGRRWYLGNYRLMERLGAGGQALKERMAELEAGGKTTVVLASAELATPGAARAEGLFAVADGLRETSVEAVSALRALGVRTLLLTGDTEATGRAMAKAAGVDEFRAGLLPEDKLAIVEELERAGARVGMVGDGINDAPALAKADVGFAMAAGGTDTAIETADVALMDDDLRKVPRFIRLSRATHAILVENIAFALSIKA
ncbi:MAG: heavy metal translocating P-type ATPase, partial [Desulfovibrio sp.]|nr:heavy metal translocating P-type ATPase [Desulfovibrio sp.]